MRVRRVLHVDLDAFFVAVERLFDPSLRGRPVAVGGHADSRGVVACASYEARAYGLKAGMPLAVAQRLCPHCTFVPGRFQRYEQASRRFFAILREFSPDVEPISLDEAYVDLTGFEPHYGPASQAASAIKDRIHREVGITASVGIASGKVIAKVASDRCKPDGLLEVPPGQERRFLAPLPLGDLPGLGPRAEAVLHGLGLTTLGELARMPVSFVRRALGVQGEALHRWANGRDDTPVSSPMLQKSHSRETTFAADVIDRRLLRGTLRYLAERVGAALRADGKQARCVTLKLRYADFHTITRQRALKRPAGADDDIFRAGDSLLAAALGERRDRVRLIGIGASDLGEAGLQLHLFTTQALRMERLSRAVDAIRLKYGFLAIQTGLTRSLERLFPIEEDDYVLKTSALSR